MLADVEAGKGETMTVYVIESGTLSEGGSCVAVFADRDAAIAKARRIAEEDANSMNWELTEDPPTHGPLLLFLKYGCYYVSVEEFQVRK